MTEVLRVLMIDDSIDDGESIERHLKKGGLDIVAKRLWDLDAIRTELELSSWDIILCDHFLPTFGSQDVLLLLQEMSLDHIPFILISGQVSTEDAIQAIRSGANDYLFKDDLSRLVPAIDREIKESQLRKEKKAADLKLRETNARLKRTLQSLANTQSQLISVERFRALGQMSSGIAHDFNNALQKMAGSIDLIQEEFGDSPHIRQIQLQFQDAAAVVRRLSDFYRETPAQAETAVEVAQLLLDAKEFTRPKWSKVRSENSATIQLGVVTDGTSSIWADPSQLREVLTNLIFNACDAIGEDGGQITLSSKIHADEVDLIITDNGSGMSPEVKRKCLDPLYSTKGDKGTGMGLSIVNGIVQSFGGRLAIKSELGKGTSIILTLRRASAGESDDYTAPIRPMVSSVNLSVAVVDDEPAIAKMLARYLEKLGHTVATFTDPIQCLNDIPQSSCDLILCDRSMPQMSGDQLIRELKILKPSLKCIMVSGYGDLMLANGELPGGVDLIIGKPVSLDHLQNAISDLFTPESDELVLAS